MMTSKQTALYWRTWSALCEEFDWRHNDTPRRHALHKAAGCPVSSKSWDNIHFDRYLAHARDLLAGTTTGDTRPVDEAGHRRRLVWRIRTDLRRAKLPETYIASLATDMYGLGCWHLLALDQLENLRNTLHNRVRKHTAPHVQTPCKPAPDPELCPF